jgi:hypothetical protein
MSPQEPSADGSGRNGSRQSSSEGSGGFRFPKSNVSEIEELLLERAREEEREPNWGCVLAFGAGIVFWTILFGIGVVLWLKW